MRKFTIGLIGVLLSGSLAFGQVAISGSGGSPDPSAMLDVQSTTSGFLPPRMTESQRDAISAPAEGLFIFNTSSKCMEMRVNGVWKALGCGCVSAPATPGPISGTTAQTPATGGQVYSISEVSGATSYTWTVPSGWTIDNGNGTAIIAVTTGAGGDDGDVTVTATNDCGSSSAQTLAVTVTVPCVIGNTGPGGGKIFYCGSAYAGKSGLESMPSDQGSNKQWGCYGTNISAANSTAIGAGQSNTAAILASCSTVGIAAYICDNLSSGGKTDWFLPSKDELSEMYSQKTAIGNFDETSTGQYLTATNIDAVDAWRVNFNNGSSWATTKSTSNYKVRCIRAF